MSDNPDEIRKDFREPTETWTEIREGINHADKAYEFMTQAKFAWKDGEEVVRFLMDCAKVQAQLALMDKVDELSQTIKFCTTQLLDSQQTLNENVKTAAQHLHRDANDLKAHLRVVQSERAA